MNKSVSDLLMQNSGDPAQELPVAFNLLGQGHVDQAAGMFHGILLKSPKHPGAWYGAGQAAAQKGDLKAAAQNFARAIQYAPDFVDAYVSLSRVYQQMNRLPQARQACLGGLNLAPDHPVLHYNLGVITRLTGDIEGAIAEYRAALNSAPDYAPAYFSLGNAFRDQGKMDEAESAYQSAVRLNPDYADANTNLGGIFAAREDHEGALAYFMAALRVQPNHVFARKNLALSLYKLGRFADSANETQKALRLAPKDMMLHYQMGEALYGLQRTGHDPAARQAAANWIAAFPDNPVAQHMSAAVLGTAPERATDAYVRETFDRFASDFEQVLGGLNYRGPELLDTLVREHMGDRSGLSILDAGCGTGLFAPLLRQRARRLVGVDLSPGMLAKAYDRKLYDSLHEAELGGFLKLTSDTYDLAVAADVFCYFGELTGVMRALASRMNPGGVLAFSVERIEGEAPAAGFRLNPTGRYAHTEAFVRDALAEAGFRLKVIRPEVARVELGNPVPSYIVLAERT